MTRWRVVYEVVVDAEHAGAAAEAARDAYNNGQFDVTVLEDSPQESLSAFLAVLEAAEHGADFLHRRAFSEGQDNEAVELGHIASQIASLEGRVRRLTP